MEHLVPTVSVIPTPPSLAASMQTSQADGFAVWRKFKTWPRPPRRLSDREPDGGDFEDYGE